MEFAKALGDDMTRHDGYQESEDHVVTWCVGHLVSMSYPEAYDPAMKKWSLSTLPFIPDTYLYEVIPSVKKQFNIVSSLLHRSDIDTIYVCTDSGREGEYIYRLVAQEAHVEGKKEKRVWIDSQTKEEILRGIREAKDLSEYDDLASSAYLRAIEDYLMGINFSRALTLKYGNSMASFLNERYVSISVGRVMTCVLGMIVRREREIRNFVKTPFYRLTADLGNEGAVVEGEWKAVEGSAYFESPKLYKENGFKDKKDAEELKDRLSKVMPPLGKVEKLEKKTEKKNPPMLYNLAELQNDGARMFKLSPDQTLAIAQELYEKKLVTYPRTDARVLSSAVAKEIDRNIKGLTAFAPAKEAAGEALASETWKNIAKTRYVNDKMITDHYALIPTGQGLGALSGLSRTAFGIYTAIVRRFLGIFFPPAVYQRLSLTVLFGGERFFAGTRLLKKPGYLSVMPLPKKERASGTGSLSQEGTGDDEEENGNEENGSESAAQALLKLKKGDDIPVGNLTVKEGETSPPKRYNSGSMILAMENAGQLIEDEELRAQIKSSGIGTSATRAEILNKLVKKKYVSLNKKTQILTPTLMGEMITDAVAASIPALLMPQLTASWEKGLTGMANGEITYDEYMDKLKSFIVTKTQTVIGLNNQPSLTGCYRAAAKYYTPKSTYSRKKKQEH